MLQTIYIYLFRVKKFKSQFYLNILKILIHTLIYLHIKVKLYAIFIHWVWNNFAFKWRFTKLSFLAVKKISFRTYISCKKMLISYYRLFFIEFLKISIHFKVIKPSIRYKKIIGIFKFNFQKLLCIFHCSFC